MGLEITRRAFEPGQIDISFRGVMNSTSRGIYAGDGFAVTQLQPNYAQSVFPCFDDPSRKATFDIAVTSEPGDVVITNGGTAARMPPHLVFIAAGEFREIHSGRIRLFSIDDPQHHAPVLASAARALDSIESYLGIAYPWEKLDLVIVPSFEVDGMESTGAIVFRAGALANEARAATLIAHEIAHQWFGSLVTPQSWADLWLSEGFATWIAAKVAGTDVDAVSEIRAAMAADSTRSARPLRYETANPKELFDATSYAKGAAMLRMLEASAGEEAFRDAIADYLRRHAHGNASTADLRFASLAEPFIDKPGVPHLKIEWSGNAIRIARTDAAKRAVPAFLRIALDDGTIVTRNDVLRDDVTEITMPATVRWVFGNANASGYYRCSYTGSDAIPLSDLSSSERTVFIADLSDAVWAAESDTLVLLRAIEEMPEHPVHRQLSDLLAAAPIDASAAEHRIADLERAGGAERIAACEALLADASTRHAGWAYLKAHWDELENDLVSFGGRGAIPALASVADPELRNDIAAFFSQHPPLGAERALQQTLEQIDSRIRFREREGRRYACRAAWLEANRPSATPQLRFAHSILNSVTSALHGSLQMRVMFDQFGLVAPEWMHTAGDLRNALGGLEGRFLRLFRGEASVDEAVMQLMLRAREDLNASGGMAENASASHLTIAVLAAREGAAREHFLSGMIAFADLLEGPPHAASLRAALPSVERDVTMSRALAMRTYRGDAGDAMRANLAAASLLLPGTFRSQAVDLAAIEAAVRGDRTFDHTAATWAAFGFSSEEATTWRNAGYTHPAAVLKRSHPGGLS